jgi:hypothetical protein
MLSDIRDLVQRYGHDGARIQGETSTDISDTRIADAQKNTLESNLSVLLTPAMS